MHTPMKSPACLHRLAAGPRARQCLRTSMISRPLCRIAPSRSPLARRALFAPSFSPPAVSHHAAIASFSRPFSTQVETGPVPPDYLTEGELDIFNKIKAGLDPVALEVQDVSGGCGSMYALDIVSPKFKGLTMIKQHRLVNELIGEDIKKWHGIQLKTKAP